MAVTPKRARELALSLENASDAPHLERVAFRTPRRIFATLARSGIESAEGVLSVLAPGR